MPCISGHDVRTLVIACDAGIAIDRLLPAQLSRRLSGDVRIAHHPVDAIPDSASVVLVQRGHGDQVQRHLRNDVPVITYDAAAGGRDLDGLLAAIRDDSPICG